MIQALSGIMDLTGEPSGPPQKMGVAFADLFTGLYGVVAIQAALAQRERTGRGQHLDLALFDSMLAVLANQAMNHLVGGGVPHRLGNAHPNIVPYQEFTVSDGHVMIAVGNDAQFARFCALLGSPQLAADPRYAGNPGRVQHRDELVPVLAAALRPWRRAALIDRLLEAGIPGAPVQNVAEAFADPQVGARELLVALPDLGVQGGTVPAVRTPIRFSNASLALGRSAPRLGEHTLEVRRELQA